MKVAPLMAVGIVLSSGCAGRSPTAASTPAASTPTATPQAEAVMAPGRIEPEGEVIRVSVPNAQDSRVNQILVKEGDRVRANQVIAILQGIDRRTADLRDAEATRRLRLAELEKVRQGDAKQAEIRAQQLEIQRLRVKLSSSSKQRQAALDSATATLTEAQQALTRRQQLVQEGVIPRSELDLLLRNQETAAAKQREMQADLEETRATLAAEIGAAAAKLAELTEVRPIDLAIAKAKLDQAQVAVSQRQADLDDVQVRAPIAGQILRINTRIGEQVNTIQGIVELAKTDRMVVIAEVAESDIGKVKLGQSASITTDYGGFTGTVRGQVERVGLQVGKRNLPDPTNQGNSALVDSNNRIVEVRIRITPQDNQKVAAFTQMQVRVRITITLNAAKRIATPRPKTL
jgi:HlyD family secretion protein